MIDKARLRNLIPHAGSMCLLDSVEEWNAEHIRCLTHTHQQDDHPLRLENRLAAVHLIEYAAQAIAAHGALLAGISGNGHVVQPGMLAAVRNVRVHVDRLDELAGPIIVSAQRRLAQGDGLIYDFKATRGEMNAETLLCEGRIVVALGLVKNTAQNNPA